MGDEQRSGLAGGIEFVTRIVAGFGAVTTVLGYAALLVQFRRLGAPMALVSVAEAARAGLLPALALGFAVLLVYAARRYERYAGKGLAAVGMVLLVPIMLVATPGVIFGLAWAAGLPLMLLSAWVPIWAIQTARFVIGIGLLYGAVFYLEAREERDRIARATAKSTPTKPATLLTSDHHGPDAERYEVPAPSPAEPSRVGEFAKVAAILAPCILACLFGLRWGAQLMGLAVPFVDGASDLAFVGVALLLTLATLVLFFLGGYLATAADRREGASATVAILVSAAFLLFLVTYSLAVYPRISPALGGGGAEPMDLWFASDGVPADALAQLGRGACARSAEQVRCRHVGARTVGDHLLLDTTEGRVIVLARGDAKALRLSLEPALAR